TASVGGTGWILRTQAADKNSKEDKSPNTSSGDSLVVGIGYVDVKRGLVSLNPTQQGRVIELFADESAKVAKGTPLLKINDTAARLTLDRAEVDLKAAEAVLSQAKKAPEAHEIDVALQNKAIAAKQMDLDDAKDKLDRIKERRVASDRYDKAV